MNRFFALGLLFCLGGAAASAQPSAVQPLSASKALSQFLLTTYGPEDGLPQVTVNALAQTPDGHLWVGTEEGVARFDGRLFTVFDPLNTPAFAANATVKALAVDGDGVLWVGTDGGGLLRRTDGTFIAVGEEQGLTGRNVSRIVEDADGRLWVGTYDAGVFVRTGDAFEPLAGEAAPPDPKVTALAAGPDGALWIGTEGGLARHDARAGTTQDFTARLPDPFVTALAVAPDGRVWVSTRGGTGTLRDGRYEPSPVVGGVEAFTLLPDAAGTLWLGTDNRGVARLVGGRLLRFGSADGLPHDRIRTFFADREGSLWVGTEGGGLAQFRDHRFTTFTTREGLGSDEVMTVFEAADGAVWVGTEGGGVTRLAGGTATTYGAADGLGSDVVLSVSADADGAVWVGTYGGGAARYADGRFERHSTATGFPSDAVFALHLGRSGTLWMGTDAGVAGYRDGAFSTITEADGLSSNQIASLFEDAHGALWVGTMHGHLNRVHEGVVAQFGPEEGLHAGIVSGFFEGADGALWISTYGDGLVRYRAGAFAYVTVHQGLPSNNVLYALPDADGFAWIATNKGLFRARSASLDAVADGTADRLEGRLFGPDDGLARGELNGGVQPAGWRGRDGGLWLATGAGAVRVAPGATLFIPRPLVQLGAVDVDGTPRRPDAPLRLAPGVQKVEFSFVAPTFVAPDDVRYRYRLEGYDEGWSETAARMVRYTNLAPGTYTFHVQAFTRDGGWSEPASVELTRVPFFYETTWFWLLLGLAALGLGGAVHRARVAALQARQRELEEAVEARTRDLRAANDHIEAQNVRLVELDRFKTRFFANISHEFRTPLTLIVGPLENALAGAYGPVGDGLRQPLAIMLRNAVRVLRLINQLLDLSKLEDGKMNLRARPYDVVPFLRGIVDAFSSYAEHKDLTLTFTTDHASHVVAYEPDKLEKVFFNLLSNAVKFTPAGGAIDVAVERVADDPARLPEGGVRVRVRDSGAGISAAELPYVFDRFRQVDESDTRQHEGTGIGLALVRELVLLHGGTVEAESTLGEGSTFVVTLPYGTDHLADEAVAAAPPEGGLEADEPAGAGEAARTALASVRPDALAEAQRGAAPPADAPPDAPLVLVVDDNREVLDYVAACIGHRYRVARAADGAEGLERAAELRPDLILADIMMPRMSGHELCRRVKADAELRHTPVVLLSAKTSQDTTIESIEAGADDYLAKPFNARELLARIGNLISLRAYQQELVAINDELEARVEAQLAAILREREAYEARLLAEKERAEAAARLKSTILDNMSHEFRTPLTAILGYAEILVDEAADENGEFAHAIQKNGQRLLRTLNAVLEMSQLEASAASTACTAVDLTPMLADVVRVHAPAAEAKGLALELSATGPAAPAFTDVDAARRIVGVIVDNAVKFTLDGGVHVELEAGPDDVAVHVHDTGIGMSPAFLDKLYEPFEQESSGTARVFEGNGLNLSIARRLADLVGATLAVETAPGDGTTFTVRFPAAATPAPEGDGAALRAPRIA